MIKLTDVADYCGVSTATVSNVLNHTGRVSEKTREKVFAAAEELHYPLNGGARKKKVCGPHNVAVLVEDLQLILSASMLDGIANVCNRKEILPQIYNLQVRRFTPNFDYQEWQQSPLFNEKIKHALHLVCRGQARGLIYLAAHSRDISSMCLPIPQQFPMVYLYSTSSQNHLCVEDDDFQGAALATDFLIRHGHRRIAVICGSFNSFVAHLRLSGYQHALMHGELYFYPEYICSGSWEEKDGYAACEKLMALPDPPTAIFAMNDAMALGAISYLIEHGLRVPEDVSIVGYDAVNPQSSHLELTSIQIPLHEMGKMAAEYLIEMFEKHVIYGKEKSRRVPCRLIEGKTVSVPRKT